MTKEIDDYEENRLFKQEARDRWSLSPRSKYCHCKKQKEGEIVGICILCKREVDDYYITPDDI